MESRVDFVCCDNPHANRLTLHILAAVAEDEARRISERTKAAGRLQGEGWKARHAREPDARGGSQRQRGNAGEGQGRLRRAAAQAAGLAGGRDGAFGRSRRFSMARGM